LVLGDCRHDEIPEEAELTDVPSLDFEAGGWDESRAGTGGMRTAGVNVVGETGEDCIEEVDAKGV
jgi:hypothetical protein